MLERMLSRDFSARISVEDLTLSYRACECECCQGDAGARENEMVLQRTARWWQLWPPFGTICPTAARVGLPPIVLEEPAAPAGSPGGGAVPMETEPAGSPLGVVAPMEAEPARAPLGEAEVGVAAQAGAPRSELGLVKAEVAEAPRGREELGKPGLAGEPAGTAALKEEQLPGLGPKRPPVPPVPPKDPGAGARVQEAPPLGSPCREGPVLSRRCRQSATSAGLLLRAWGSRKGWTMKV